MKEMLQTLGLNEAFGESAAPFRDPQTRSPWGFQTLPRRYISASMKTVWRRLRLQRSYGQEPPFPRAGPK